MGLLDPSGTRSHMSSVEGAAIQRCPLEWEPEAVAVAYGIKPLRVSMMRNNGACVKSPSQAWSFVRWTALASSLSTPSTTPVPYLRDLLLPKHLLATALVQSPFPPDRTAVTLFAGQSTASSDLHCEAVSNALLVVHGTQLVVMLRNEGIPQHEVQSLNIIIATWAATGHFPRPKKPRTWLETLRGSQPSAAAAATIEHVDMGNVVVTYTWLDAGARLLIPSGWLQFTFCAGTTNLSLTYRHKPLHRPPTAIRTHLPQSGGASSLHSPAVPGTGADAEKPPTTAPAGSRLDTLSIVFLEQVLLWCFGDDGRGESDGVSPVLDASRAVCRAACTCRALRAAASDDALWRRCYELQWGPRALKTADVAAAAAAAELEPEAKAKARAGGVKKEPQATFVGGQLAGRGSWWAAASVRLGELLYGGLGPEGEREWLRAARALKASGLVASNAELAALLHAHGPWLDRDAITTLLSVHDGYLASEYRAQQEETDDSRGDCDGGDGTLLGEWMIQLAPSFRGLSLEAALRMLILLCTMPTEAGKWPRVLSAFAQAHFALNPDGPFANSDDAMTFSYSMAMLSYNLHHCAISPDKRMTATAFENCNRGIYGQFDLDSDFVQRTYASIKAASIFVYMPPSRPPK